MTEPVVHSCRDIVEIVTEYLEGGLSADERLAFERHVAICPPCRGYLAQVRRIVAAAPGLHEEDLSPSLRAGLLEAFADWKTRRER